MSSLPDDFDRSKLQDRSYKGDDYNVKQELQKGPQEGGRKCTDILFLIIFLGFFGFMFYMIGYGIANGNPGELIAPIDAAGNICGWTAGYEEYDHLYIADINSAATIPTNVFEYGVCAKSCPTKDSTTVECKDNAKVSNCKSFEIYGTLDAFSYCLPVQSELPVDAQSSYQGMKDAFLSTSAGSYVLDLYLARWVILTCIGLSFVFALIYIKLMDWFAFWLSWISVGLVQASLIGVGYFFYAWRQDSINAGDDYSDWLWWGMFISWLTAGLYYVILACNMRSLRVSIAIIETAADFFADTKRVVLIPLGYFFFGLVMFMLWFWGFICVSSVGTIDYAGIDPDLQFRQITWDDTTYAYVYTMLFGILWIFSFLIAANEFAVIVSASTWYFSRKDIPDDDGIPGDAQVWKGFWWTVRYHAGSLAFGSLILTIVWVIRLVFEYVGNKMQEASGNNGCTKCLVSCIRCCLACFDRFVRYINRNAYIYMAISSENFCSSALNSFILILKNMAKFSFVEGIGGVFMFIAKFCIAITTTVCGFLLLGVMIEGENQVKDPFLPTAIIFAFAYLVGTIFISIFDTSANTILQCYLIDVDIQRQSGVECNHIPATLLRFIESQNLQISTNPDEEKKEQLQANLLE